MPQPNAYYLHLLSILGTWEGWVWVIGELKPQLDNLTQLSTADGRSTVALRRPTTDQCALLADNLSPG